MTQQSSGGERLTIGAFARRSMLSPKALRLYDSQGLLVPAEVDPQTGYRLYREEQLATARLIARLRQLDMPLSVVEALIKASPMEQPLVLAHWWDMVEARISSQRELIAWLLISMSGKERPLDHVAVEERDVPEQIVLTEQRHITAADLPAWLDSRTSNLIDRAMQHGGLTGNCFVVYHGEVSEDSDGPVEICVPVHPDHAANEHLPVRIEPAHREAFTRITKAQVVFPQILGAYDAVEHWATANNRVVSGAPREIYYPTFITAAPDDLVCDIAFPIAAS